MPVEELSGFDGDGVALAADVDVDVDAEKRNAQSAAVLIGKGDDQAGSHFFRYAYVDEQDLGSTCRSFLSSPLLSSKVGLYQPPVSEQKHLALALSIALSRALSLSSPTPPHQQLKPQSLSSSVSPRTVLYRDPNAA